MESPATSGSTATCGGTDVPAATRTPDPSIRASDRATDMRPEVPATAYEVGQHRYRIRSLNASSDKYGPCEVCKRRVSDVHYQVEERFFRHSTGILREGWTQAGCRSPFGHDSCLKAQRRGTYLCSVFVDGAEYAVHAPANSETAPDQPDRR